MSYIQMKMGTIICMYNILASRKVLLFMYNMLQYMLITNNICSTSEYFNILIFYYIQLNLFFMFCDFVWFFVILCTLKVQEKIGKRDSRSKNVEGTVYYVQCDFIMFYYFTVYYYVPLEFILYYSFYDFLFGFGFYI